MNKKLCHSFRSAIIFMGALGSILVGISTLFHPLHAHLKVTANVHAKQGLKSPSQYVSDETWQEVSPFLMPPNHPIRSTLNRIVSSSRAFSDKDALKAAGFASAEPQHHSEIIVTTHPKLKGYIIKAFLDSQDYHSGKPEYYFWLKRCTGAKLIQDYIVENKYTHLFKVPKKWIFLLPDSPSPPSHYLRKQFILVEEDMNLEDARTNKKIWGSDQVTKELLHALYSMTTDLGLFDCTKLDNCPFSKDGKVAFIDTQSHGKSYVKYHKLTPYLSSSMRIYWKELIKGTQK